MLKLTCVITRGTANIVIELMEVMTRGTANIVTNDQGHCRVIILCHLGALPTQVTHRGHCQPDVVT